MLDSLLQIISSSAEAGTAASHSPQTAFAAILCMVLINFLS